MENKYSENIMRRCRERLGLEPDDTSKDELINQYSPKEAFRECCIWEGLMGSWSDTLIYWIEDCFKIEL